MWRKWNPGALLVEMQTAVAIVEDSMEIAQKALKNSLKFLKNRGA